MLFQTAVRSADVGRRLESDMYVRHCGPLSSKILFFGPTPSQAFPRRVTSDFNTHRGKTLNIAAQAPKDKPTFGPAYQKQKVERDEQGASRSAEIPRRGSVIQSRSAFSVFLRFASLFLASRGHRKKFRIECARGFFAGHHPSPDGRLQWRRC